MRATAFTAFALMAVLTACGANASAITRDWPGKGRFCAAAEKFDITAHEDLSEAERSRQLGVLSEAAPEEIREDLTLLFAAKEDADDQRDAGQRTGAEIERICGVNLPGIVTSRNPDGHDHTH